MTRENLIERLVEPRFPVGFATTMARGVLADDAFDALYSLAVDSHDDLNREVRHRLYFRAAYVLERIFFIAPELFAPYVDDFFDADFPNAPMPVPVVILQKSWRICCAKSFRILKYLTGLPKPQRDGRSIRKRKSPFGFGVSKC